MGLLEGSMINMKHQRIPLYQALKEHSEKKPISFHVPGHKYGEVFPMDDGAHFRELLKIDVTELSGLDDLHSPEGIILEAEALLAELYGVKHSFFLVNGTTVGNLAMVMAVCKEGDIILVQRNCHKSIMNAIRLVKARPIFLEPEFEKLWGIASEVSYDIVEQAICLYPDAKGLILTYPNYYGMTYDLKAIINLVHRNQIPVLIDEAHGAHFIIGEDFPESAVQLGADIVVQSAHKTLPAMTMGSYLHYNSSLISLTELTDYLQILQSSSPSYPIMASLDIARSFIGTFSVDDHHYLRKQIDYFKKALGQIEGIKVLAHQHPIDPLKVTIQSTQGLSGFELQRILEEVGVYSELADPMNLLLVLPLLKKGQSTYFENALKRFEDGYFGVSDLFDEKEYVRPEGPAISKLALTYKQMESLPAEIIALNEASGKIAAETITPYPPGIPYILPGEVVSNEKIEYLQYLIKYGTRFQGGNFLKEGKIKVFQLLE